MARGTKDILKDLSQHTRDLAQKGFNVRAIHDVENLDDKSYIDVAALDEFMIMCPGICIGRRFTRERDVLHYIHRYNIRYILNVRGADGDKTMWYHNLATKRGVKTIKHVPLETSEDKDRTRVADKRILYAASQVADWYKTLTKNDAGDGKPVESIFIHGYEAAHIATVIGLVAWYLIMDDNTFNPHKALAERYDAEIGENFPQHWFHREQVTRICAAQRKSVFAAMRRGGLSVTRKVRTSTRPTTLADAKNTTAKRCKLEQDASLSIPVPMPPDGDDDNGNDNDNDNGNATELKR